MIATATLVGTGVSLAAIGYLAATDPKRRSAFRLPPVAERHPRLAWWAVLLPGIAVTWFAGAGGMLVWAGAITVAGWALAAVRPGGTGALSGVLADAVSALRQGTGRAVAGTRTLLRGASTRLATARPAVRSSGGDRVAALEARVAALEAEIAALRGIDEPSAHGVVVELPLPARR